ncbi:hypothetical protein ACFQHW_06345 [Lapidilactobacillus achengensis]|uniref:Transposase n=1 Tax=Lapidilactobacillus achengensis TaxID=2486000 RepID=A0ABW1UQ64_9LACO|nr:hypothetical protein [Lapidilactobacillus achengensis]
MAMRIHSKFGYCSVEETKMDARLEKWLKQEKAKKKKSEERVNVSVNRNKVYS